MAELNWLLIGSWATAVACLVAMMLLHAKSARIINDLLQLNREMLAKTQEVVDHLQKAKEMNGQLIEAYGDLSNHANYWYTEWHRMLLWQTTGRLAADKVSEP